MKRVFFILFVLLQSISFFGQSNIDVLRYQYTLVLNDTNDSIQGTALIKVLCKEPLSSFKLDLTGIGRNQKGMRVKTVGLIDISFPNSPRGKPTVFRQENDKLNIDLKKPFKAGDSIEVLVSYSGIPSDGLIISKNKYGHRTFFADNWPNRAHNWIPCIDDPADKSPVEFIVTAPSHYQVVSNGVQVEETNLPGNKKLTHWKEDMPLPTKVMVIGVADFAVNYAGLVNDCIPVTSWVFPENKTEGFNDYAEAVKILSWMINYIGPYPYKKLADVQSKTMFGGMENASAIFYSENSVNGRRQQESLLAHEITHQWFGNTATEKSFAHLWLSEGFATYFTHLYLESKYGTDSLNKRMRKDRSDVLEFVKSSGRSVVDSSTDYMQLLNENSYQKGGWILHMLRRQLGDSLFRKCIRTYYASYAWKNADTRDLQKVIETVTGKRLDTFFTQWLYKPVNPLLRITWKYIEPQQMIAITVEQLQNDLFVFPLDISIQSGSNRVEHLYINKKAETFNLPAKEKPVRLIADPDTSLLFQGTWEETH